MNPQQNTIKASDGTPLDPSVVLLAKSIAHVETGGKYDARGRSGEYGKYQFTQPKWRALAGKYLGNPDADVTDPVNQDKSIYYGILEDKQARLS